MDALNALLFVGRGLGGTLALASAGMFGACCLGLTWGLLRFYNVGSRVVTSLISLIRGVPLILQLSIIYFTFPVLFGLRPTVFWSGCIAFTLNSSTYVAEILRSGLGAIPQGQWEAARVLEIPAYHQWRRIIGPQLIKLTLAPLTAELIALLKETAIISMLGGYDLMRYAQILTTDSYDYFQPLCIAAVYYYTLVILIEKFGRFLEARYDYIKDH